MIIRLRSRDGLERLEVEDGCTVGGLRRKIQEQLGVPLRSQILSKDQGLLVTKDPEKFEDMADATYALSALGIRHGEMLYMWYDMERDVEPMYKKSEFEARPFGAHMNMEMLSAMQTRIEMQEEPTVASVSFDRDAANMFQAYSMNALGFSIKRAGILYGTVDEGGNVKADVIYEPPQQGSAAGLVLERGTEEELKAEELAGFLGLKKVGWIFSRSTAERDFIMSTDEVCQMAAFMEEIGEQAVTAVVELAESEEGQYVHFEAFQCSQQAAKLHKEGWFRTDVDMTTGFSKMVDPREPTKKLPIVVAGKDVDEVDNDFFLCTVKIMDHASGLLADFPIENRLDRAPSNSELRAHLTKHAARPYVERLSDFHLLLWLSRTVMDGGDIALIADAVRTKHAVGEGYRQIIDALAGV
mmetsp:Transcript_19174/g.49224  ORF Transcript_19174/g.49224 Transcript_19174/m.49224 type:complete len:413 (-) Transcript_19174:16-1254(-)|eukprot:jgi/Tetstr1/462375/TSEL_007381.t1